jgi:hypothetical protein
MAKCYFELRNRSARGTDSAAADIMRHLHSRQHLGKAVVICEQPTALLAACRKQWLKLSRAIQKQRASTLNADKILKYTHTITHMQRLRFTSKTPLEEAEADIYFLEPKHTEVMPLRCYTIYVHSQLERIRAATVTQQLPAETLIVDYSRGTDWPGLGLQPKNILEMQVASEWSQIKQFLISRSINISTLTRSGRHNIEAMDDALDTLLAASNQFLRIANEFQRALELARPLRVHRKTREEYDALVLLAYRVQALSPGLFTQHFLESYNEDDTFFLYDIAKRRFMASGEPLAEAVARHTAAGRKHLAYSLRAMVAAG